MKKEEYMIQIWGGAWNHDAEPSIEKDLGIKDGYYYFDTPKELDNFVEKLKPYGHLGIVTNIKHGIMSHKRTIAVCTFEYKGKEYIVDYDFGYEYEEERAHWMFYEGNYSCDCNRSMFIARQYGDDVIEELDCGDKIKLIDFKIEYKD